jgi:hypothetical protein
MPPAAPEPVHEKQLTQGVSPSEHINDATRHTAPLIRRFFDVSVDNNSDGVKFEHDAHHRF